MKIAINKEYIIYSDEFQYILRKCNTVKSGERKGKIRYMNVGYFNTIQQAIKAWADRDLRLSDCRNIDDVISHLKSQEVLIKKMFT